MRVSENGGTRGALAVVAVVLLVASLVGCVRDEGLSGMGLPRLSGDQRVDAAPVPFQGTLHVGPQGCLMVRLADPTGDAAERWTVWPDGAERVPDTGSGGGAQVDGEQFMGEDRIAGSGRLVDLADLPQGDSPGSYFYGSGRYCDALVEGVLVIDSVQHA